MRFATILAILLTLPIKGPVIGAKSTVVDQIFAAYDKPESPGCALGVIQDGNFIYRRSYGMASLELGVPLSSQSAFYMGSVSKQFTAASIVLAAEQGFLSLDDDVRKFIPEIPIYGHTVTLRQMLHHTSGFSDVLGLLEMSGRNAEDLHPRDELMDLIVRQHALNYDPGDTFTYSNTNYFLLAEVLKRATQKPLSEFAAENIFKPLGMTHTRFYDDHTMVVPGRIPAYKPSKNGSFLVNWSTNYDEVGGGGLISTIDDLLLWDRNFYKNKLGKGTLLKALQTRGVLNNGKEISYALGMYMSAYRGLPIVEHGGGLFGYRSEILRFPQQRFTVACLCNVANADPAILSRKVADIYLDKSLQQVPSAATSGSDPTLFAGRYFNSRTHYLVSFTVVGGKLVLQGDFLRPIEPSRFIDDSTGGTVTFSEIKGAMQSTVNWDNEVTFTGTRIQDYHLSDADLAGYVGTYKSNDLDATYNFSVENGSFVLRMSWSTTFKLEPIVQNEFHAGDGATLVFHRDSNNLVSGLSVFSGWNGWMHNDTFVRVK